MIPDRDKVQRSGVTSVERDARLVEQLVISLRAQQQKNGAWPGDDLSHTLRNTCHALEALYLLGSATFPRIIANGVHWLLNLADEIDADSSAWISIRLHPSRFKTLARLREFQDEKLQEDFAELCGRIGEDGLLNKVLVDQLLGSLIVMDTLLELRTVGHHLLSYDRIASCTLPTIKSCLVRWCGSHQDAWRQELINNVGEASYALDILLRSHTIELSDPLCASVRTAMLDALSPERNQRTLEKDALYSAIQLSTYFSNDREVTTALNRFHQHLHQRLGQSESRRWYKQDDMPPLIVRMLLTCGGAELSQSLIGNLWEEAFASRQHLTQERDIERRQQFAQLIRQRVEIEIRDVEDLTGGITTARVFRVEYAIQEDILADKTTLHRNSATHVVIKADSHSALERSIAQFQRLPADLQKYFAHHAPATKVNDASETSAFMVLEDLTDEYATFREVLNEVDKRRPSPDDRARLEQAATAIMNCLVNIYSRTLRPIDDIAGFQVSRLYFSRLDRSLLDMVSEHRFPRLKDFFQGFTLETEDGVELHFKSIGYYQQALQRHFHRLRPPCLVMTHGDCHSRNIMLDNCFERVKFIDLDRIDVAGDYILDIALLLEDVALFRRFFDEKYRFFLRPEDITLSIDRNHIAYPTFVTETAQLFQRLVLETLADFAKRYHDRYYRERLWLGIALHLLRLVDKQNEIRSAAALYVEAIKLLDALVHSMNGQQLLPPMPVGSSIVPNAGMARHLEAIHAHIIRCQAPGNRKILYDLRASGRVIRYFVTGAHAPFAILDGKTSTVRLQLACPAEELWGVGALAQPINEGTIQAVLVVDPDANDSLQRLTEIIRFVLKRMT